MIRHIILTRFLYTDKLTKFRSEAERDEYIQKRIDLFKRYTLPSVTKLQEESRVEWQIRSNLNIRDIGNPNAKIVSKWQLPKEPCITTRLDNDDMLLPGFCEAIKQNVRSDKVIIDTEGYILDHATGRMWESEKYGPNGVCQLSPFISFAEFEEKKKGVCFCSHNEIHRKGFGTIKLKDRLYVQVIHDTNEVNSLRKLGNEVFGIYTK